MVHLSSRNGVDPMKRTPGLPALQVLAEPVQIKAMFRSLSVALGMHLSQYLVFPERLLR
jgi:hypothetical protein